MLIRRPQLLSAPDFRRSETRDEAGETPLITELQALVARTQLPKGSSEAGLVLASRSPSHPVILIDAKNRNRGPTSHDDEIGDRDGRHATSDELHKMLGYFTNFARRCRVADRGPVGGLVFSSVSNGGDVWTAAPISLDDLSLPSRDTLPSVVQRRNPLHISTSRGCMARCHFCSITAFQRASAAPRWRHRSIESIVGELAELWARGVRHVKFVDDSFLEPPRDVSWCRDFASAIEDARLVGMTLRGSIRADRVDMDIARELRRSGFVSFSCGVENFADSALRRMNKSATTADNIAALDALRAAGLLVQMGMIMFDQETTLEELRTNAIWLRRYDHIVIKGVFTEMYAAEGTALTNVMRARNLLDVPESVQNMNSTYTIKNPQVRSVYTAMKLWHKSNMRLYDRAIDPVSSPKALDLDELQLFMPWVSRLRQIDLDVLDSILYTASERDDGLVLERKVAEMRLACEEELHGISSEVDRLYSNFGLSYDASDNPFI